MYQALCQALFLGIGDTAVNKGRKRKERESPHGGVLVGHGQMSNIHGVLDSVKCKEED